VLLFIRRSSECAKRAFKHASSSAAVVGNILTSAADACMTTVTYFLQLSGFKANGQLVESKERFLLKFCKYNHQYGHNSNNDAMRQTNAYFCKNGLLDVGVCQKKLNRVGRVI
jgi:hypothetical protein